MSSSKVTIAERDAIVAKFQAGDHLTEDEFDAVRVCDDIRINRDIQKHCYDQKLSPHDAIRFVTLALLQRISFVATGADLRRQDLEDRLARFEGAPPVERSKPKIKVKAKGVPT